MNYVAGMVCVCVCVCEREHWGVVVGMDEVTMFAE